MIDIILLTYNDIDNTAQCVNHLYKFTDDFNLTILDNDSTDGTKEYLERLSKHEDNLTLFFSEKNLGIIDGRNKAYELSKNSEYVCFIDNDQFVERGWLESYLEFFNSGFDIVGIEAWIMREKDFYPIKKISDHNDSFSYVGCGGMALRRSVIKDIGLFDERYEKCYFEDPDINWRAYKEGYKIGWNYNPVIEHHHSGPLLSKENRKYFMENWKKFRDKWKGSKVPVLKML